MRVVKNWHNIYSLPKTQEQDSMLDLIRGAAFSVFAVQPGFVS